MTGRYRCVLGKAGFMTAGAALLLAAGVANASSRPLYEGRNDEFRGKSLEQQVQLLVDREEIRDLIAIYAHRAANRQSMADLFTDDGAFINRPTGNTAPQVVRGRPELDAFFNSLGTQPQQPLPMLHNFLISVEGDEARALSSIEVRILHDGHIMDGSGYYRDRFRRVDGRWKFVERDCTFLAMIPQANPAAKPSAPR
jgi:hypothetical protein